MQFSFGIKLN